MPSYLKGRKIVKHHKDLNIDKTSKKYVVQQKSKPTFVSTLMDRLDDKEKFRMEEKNFSVKDSRFSTSPNLTVSNLPKLGFKPAINFVMTQEDLDEMISTPKIIVRESAFKYKDIHDDIYLITQHYLFAPWLSNKDLPCVYRMSVQRSPNGKHFAVSLQAVVGGCLDGAVNLLRVDSPHKIVTEMKDYDVSYPHLHKAVAGKPNRRFEHLPKSELDVPCENVEDALKILLNMGNIKYRTTTSELKLFDFIKQSGENEKFSNFDKVDAEEVAKSLPDFISSNIDVREFVHNDAGFINIKDLDLV